MSNVHDIFGPRRPDDPDDGRAGPPRGTPPPRERAINLPGVVLGTVLALALVHLLRQALSPSVDFELLLLFSFLPVRYLDPSVFPAGWAAGAWTFLTYALLHGDWMHLIVNGVWLTAFGAAVARRFGARRFGAGRFLVFFALTAVGGAVAHLVTHWGEPVPMVGASGAVSGLTAGALRFAFGPGGPLSRFGTTSPAAYTQPARPLGAVLRDRQALVFLAVWFGINLLFGAGALATEGGGASVAWQAHIGGFVAGLALFPLLDPIGRERR